MSRRVVAVGLVVFCATVNSVHAQYFESGRRFAELLGRAESLQVIQGALDSLRMDSLARNREGRTSAAGPLRVVLWSSVPPDYRAAVADGAYRYLRESGLAPDSFIATQVVIQMWATDTAALLQQADMAGRRPLRLVWVNDRHPDQAPGDTTNVAERVASQLAWAYVERCDSSWALWLDRHPSVQWRPELEGEWALRGMADVARARGRECLGGAAEACAMWLGLDPPERAYSTRYTADEVRDAVLNSWRRSEDVRRCNQGNDEACLAEAMHVLDPMPSPAIMRSGLLWYIRTRHGADVVLRALADTVGPIGARLERATGASLTDLLREWRAWTLGRGRTDRVRANILDALPVLALVLACALASTRRPRWTS